MKNKYFQKFLLIAAILFLVTFSFPFIVYGYFENWEVAGTFGDSFGALNALYSGLAFSGLIITILIQKKELRNQRKELQLQRKEMIETRKEFLLNRFTNLIYNQLERFEKTINELVIYSFLKPYNGYNAIAYLEKLRKYHKDDDTKTLEENLENKKIKIAEESKIYLENIEEIEKFAQNTFNSVQVVKSLIYNSILDAEDLNELKNLFFQNIGFTTMAVIENISSNSDEVFKVFLPEDYARFKLPVIGLQIANVFLKPLKEFYYQNITSDNFEVLKQEWKKNN